MCDCQHENEKHIYLLPIEDLSSVTFAEASNAKGAIKKDDLEFIKIILQWKNNTHLF